MKRWTMMAALVAAMVVAGQAFAGSACCPMSGKKKSSESSCQKYLSGIELTAEQQEKITAIEDACKAKGSTPEACEDSMAKIRDVLTADQRAAFDAAAGKSEKKEGCGS
jgi:Spy/CpxP family protein refolding chaperone